MSNKFSNIKERILYILEIKGIVKEKFFQKIGMTYGNFTGKAKNTPLNSNAIGNILLEIPDINPEWLLTGKGEVLKDTAVYKKLEDTEVLKLELTKELKELEKSDIKLTQAKKLLIPFVGIQAVGGFGNQDFSIQEQDVKNYYVVPKFQGRRIDFMIEVSGASMYPKYNSGDVVACTIIRDSQFLQWNKVHVIATQEQGILIKRIKKGPDNNTITAVSDNKTYDPFDIPINEITGIALVVGVIRLE